MNHMIPRIALRRDKKLFFAGGKMVLAATP